MEGILNFISIIFIVFGILQIILFFKMWGMTNDVKELKNLYADRSKELASSINRLSDVIKSSIPKEEKQPVKKNIIPEKKFSELIQEPYKKAPENELPAIDENSNDFKQHLRKWKILKDKGYVEQAVREYMEYTQLERDFAEDFINNL
ncbi:hypothetical protein [Bacteroides thetaiotaomicron]|jgi:hypothetical protein bacD2_23875|uniref:Uncharacterized protein n=1 Tax=Bacteroides thetaiotaomicron TaxID=818 RepID=A0A174UPJ5_BACT4|nr:hypothetical protein [Bacteroides thetaiotaomicron]CUQ24142.1 Uncharacterised protein [Bacteroides thetaiotaomicron]DAN79737.1 MAG TPA: hypothetical protein [Caudoviricetes sp.]